MTTVRSGTGRTDGRSLDAVGAGPTLLSSSPSLLPNEVITIGSGSLKLGTNSSPFTPSSWEKRKQRSISKRLQEVEVCSCDHG